MKKNILIILLIVVIGFLLYRPTFDIFDLLAIRRHETGIRELNIAQRYYYDLNRDGTIDEKDLNIMREFILNY